MKRLILAGLLAAALTGCAHNYTMRLTNGRQITTASKPKLKKGYYYYKDAKGEVNMISQSRVLEIMPSSMAEKDRGMFKPGLR